MAHRTTVLHDIYEERARQDFKWGGSEHDDENSMSDWRHMIKGRCERVPLTRADDRRLLVEVAALAVAAIEALDRAASWEQTYD